MVDIASDEEENLLDNIRSGDIDSFRKVFDQNWSSLCNVAAIYTHDMDLAEEIVAGIFADFWFRRNEIELSVKIKTYLYTAVRNRTQNLRRDSKRQQSLLESVSPLDLSGISPTRGFGDTVATLEFNDSLESAAKAVNSLPERYRTAFILRYRDEMEYVDIASILGTSINGVQLLVSRAIKMIKAKI